jgi:GAF domain-containing protein
MAVVAQGGGDMTIPAELQAVFDSDAPGDEKMARLMQVLCDVLACDRCLLFLRDPDTRKTRCTHGYEIDPGFAFDRPDEGWVPHPESIETDDPMFAEAMHNPEALFIEDIETAPSDLVNAEYERENFKHRALIHAPLQHGGKLYGVLEPCTMEEPRVWSERDREITAWTMKRLTPIAMDYIAANCR